MKNIAKNKKIGIIAEYNPLHNGHLYQLKKIREIFGNDCIITVVLSGNYVQRGEVSFLDKWSKTELALHFGVDIVAELPCYYSIQNAEQFALGSIKIMEMLEIDILVFGSENDDINEFNEILNIQESSEYNKILQENLKNGNNYISATKKALDYYKKGEFLKSNNILGLEYLRAIKKINSNMKYYIIKRVVSDYNEIDIPKNRLHFASASYIRANFHNIVRIYNYLPVEVLDKMLDKNYDEVSIKNKIFELFKYRFLTDSKEELIRIYDMNIDLYSRIIKVINKCTDYYSFKEKIRAKNVTEKRIDRIFMNVLLQIYKNNLEECDINFEIYKNKFYVRILGFSNNGKKILKNASNKNIFVNWKDIEKNNLLSKNLIDIEKKGFSLAEIIMNRKERLNPIVYED